MNLNLKSLLKSKKMVVMLGSGGVGKTTLSSSVGLLSADSGKKTMVMTIDPAKRLANALGIRHPERGEGSHRWQVAPDIPLYAIMLDTQHTFDTMIQKYAPSEDAAKKILENRIYHLMSSLMAATTEYMAIEQLYDLYESKEYDLIVLDTPPAKHLFSFLEAPDRLTRFLDDQILKWFFTPYLKGGKFGLKLFTSSSHLIFKAIEKLTGSQLLHDLSEFLFNLEGIYAGFRDRAKRIKEILNSPAAAFILISSPEHLTTNYATSIYQNLNNMGVSLDGWIMNRVTPEIILSETEKKEYETLKSIHGTSGTFKIFEHHQSIALRDQETIQKLKKNLPSTLPTCTIPFFTKDICDIESLRMTHKYLSS